MSVVQLDIKTWESLEDVEDRALLQEKLPCLHIGPHKAGTLRWKEVRDVDVDHTPHEVLKELPKKWEVAYN